MVYLYSTLEYILPRIGSLLCRVWDIIRVVQIRFDAVAEWLGRSKIWNSIIQIIQIARLTKNFHDFR